MLPDPCCDSSSWSGARVWAGWPADDVVDMIATAVELQMESDAKEHTDKIDICTDTHKDEPKNTSLKNKARLGVYLDGLSRHHETVV